MSGAVKDSSTLSVCFGYNIVFLVDSLTIHGAWSSLFLSEAKTGSVSGSSRVARTGAWRDLERGSGPDPGLESVLRWETLERTGAEGCITVGPRRILYNSGIECDTHQVANM